MWISSRYHKSLSQVDIRTRTQAKNLDHKYISFKDGVFLSHFLFIGSLQRTGRLITLCLCHVSFAWLVVEWLSELIFNSFYSVGPFVFPWKINCKIPNYSLSQIKTLSLLFLMQKCSSEMLKERNIRSIAYINLSEYVRKTKGHGWLNKSTTVQHQYTYF